MEEEKIYKTHIPTHIVCIAVQGVGLLIALTIVSGVLQSIGFNPIGWVLGSLRMWWLLFLINDWYNVLVIMTLVSFGIPAIRLTLRKMTTVTLQDTRITIEQGKFQESYDLQATKIVFDPDPAATDILRGIGFKYVIKIIEEGRVKPIYAYSFTKKDFFALKYAAEAAWVNYAVTSTTDGSTAWQEHD